MTLDGLFLSRLNEGFQNLCPAKIQKIHNLSDHELLFSLHSAKGRHHLVINAQANDNLIYLADKSDGLPNPSQFVMLLRKRLTNARIISFQQPNFDRILDLTIESRNELHDLETYHLYVELMGKYANIILVQDGVIVDCLKRIPFFENAKRTLLPSAQYTLPEQGQKADPYQLAVNIDQSLVQQAYGFSPLLSDEVLYRLKQGQSYQAIMNELKQSQQLYVYQHQWAHVLALTHLGQPDLVLDLHTGLAHLVQEKQMRARVKAQTDDIWKLIERERKKLIKKRPKLVQALEETDQAQTYKEYGQLLYTHLPELEKKEVLNIEGHTISINMKYDLKTNANRFFNQYHKLKRAKAILQDQIEQCDQDLAYFELLKAQLSYANVKDAIEIRQELVDKGILYVKKKASKQKKAKKIDLLKIEDEQSVIFIGKNNLQNTYLTFTVAHKNDLWFHAQDLHGAHVILRMEQPDEKHIRLAAMLAAYYSKGRYSSSVPVQYTKVHQLKKVPHASLGFVTMKSHSTIYIDPDEAYLNSIV